MQRRRSYGSDKRRHDKAFEPLFSATRFNVRHHEPSLNDRCDKRITMFAIKAEVSNPTARAFVFSEQKTMYGGKHVAVGDLVFIFASENEGGTGLVASGIITSASHTSVTH